MIKRLFRILRLKPCITVSEYGQLTENNHRYAVGFASGAGVCGALTFEANSQGYALAVSYANSYAHITGFPVLNTVKSR